MSKMKTNQELHKHRSDTISKIDILLTNLINSGEQEKMGKSDKICYWLENYVHYLTKEDKFNPFRLRNYKRGEIIKVNFGFRIGCELGGLHYAIVLDKKNSKKSPIITVLPLKSLKEFHDPEHLKKSEIYLGEEIYKSLDSKLNLTLSIVRKKLDVAKNKTIIGLQNNFTQETFNEFSEQLKKIEQEITQVEKMLEELQKMKKGSIALLSQVTSISKMRIYDPKSDTDVLSNVKIPSELLDKIDDALIANYTNNK